jgi:site-specific recombinase
LDLLLSNAGMYKNPGTCWFLQRKTRHLGGGHITASTQDNLVVKLNRQAARTSAREVNENQSY